MPSQYNILVKCPNCYKSLMDQEILVDDLPSIHLQAKVGDKIGNLYLSTIYGSYKKIFDGIDDIEGSVVVCSCPDCHHPLPFEQNCECNAPILGLALQVGGVIKFCSRNGCKKHFLEFENADDAFMLFQSQDTSGLA